MRPTLIQDCSPRPATHRCTPVWCAERRRSARVGPGRVITLRHDTGESTRHLVVDAPPYATADSSFPAAPPPLRHPKLAEAIARANVGERCMYLGTGRVRSVVVESVEPAPTLDRAPAAA